MRNNSAEILFRSFPQKALVRSSGMGRDVYSLMLSIQRFLPVANPPRCPEGWFWRGCRGLTCPLLTVARRTLHQVVGVVLQVGDTEKFPQALGFESLDPFLIVSKQGPCFTAVEEDGDDKGLVELLFLYSCK